jgi:hypothetical protein
MVFGDEEPNGEDAIIDVKQERSVTQCGRSAATEYGFDARLA